jgi:hypothetical protein
MDRRVMSMVLLTLAGVVGACGGDDSGDKGGTSGSGSVAPMSDKTVCMGTTCALPEGVEGTLCCTDAFTGKCGIKSGNGDSCTAFPEDVDSRCPVPTLGMMGMGAGAGFLFGCCAPSGECGIGFGSMACQPVSSLCGVIPKQFVSMITAQTCDGEPVTLPENCGTDTTFAFPGRGGSGGATTGAGGMSGGGGS